MAGVARVMSPLGADGRGARRRFLAAAASVSFLASMGVTALAAPPAGAAPVVWTPAGACGSVQTFTVPTNVFSMNVSVTGGAGGRGGSQSDGEQGAPGAGSTVTATIAVVPGTTISAVVGCAGRDGGDFDNNAAANGWGDGGGAGRGQNTLFDQGGASGGSGGGASAVCTTADCAPGSGKVVVVAGGGGGGGSGSCSGTRAGAGGAAAAGSSTTAGAGSGPSGANGANGGNTGDNPNGGAGGAGGVNNTLASANGGTSANGSGGAFVNVVGGGGGGGYVGGAAGSGANTGCKGGGGGGGGSSWTSSKATAVTTAPSSGDPGIVVSFGASLPTLRVTTSPALPASIIVDGTERNDWGIDWAAMAAGPHQVCFGEVPGYVKPVCQDVDLSVGNTTVVQGTYSANGYLRVITSPAVHSTISVNGVARNDWGLWTEVVPGTYNVCFGAVAGQNTPPCRDVVVTAGSTGTTTGDFTANPAAPGPGTGFGFLRATSAPAYNGMISVDGVERNSWGLDWLRLPVGNHEVCFGPTLNAVAPSCSTATITEGADTVITGTYTPKGFLRVITDPAVPATITVDGQVANSYGMWTSKPQGAYDICFSAIPGYVTPPCQNDVVVGANVTTNVTGAYVPEP